MGIVIGLFPHADALYEALERLEEEGFGREIVREEPEDADASALRESDIGMAAGTNQAGAFDELSPSSDLTRFDLSDEEYDFLQRALDRGASMIAVDTDREDEVADLFEELDAQQVKRP